MKTTIAFSLSLLFLFLGNLLAQPNNDRISSAQAIDQTSAGVANLKFDNIGPTVFSGRVTDIAINPSNPTHFYVAYASGGLWETKNNGTTFTPIFDNEATMTIGDIAVNWNTKEIWVGTGEVNSSRSSYAGVGVYKSKDNGASWDYVGLPESHHIGRIILDVTDPNKAWVAVLGHLYSTNPERGVYMTEDGGVTWSQTLFINDDTGVVDMIRDHQNPSVFYAAAWQRSRRAWDFVESGKGSGIYKSIDSGKTWNKISGATSGFPDGEGTGRIGLSMTNTSSGTRIYALLDDYNRRPNEQKDDQEGLSKDDFKTMTKDQFLELDKKELTSYLRSNRFPQKYSADKVISLLKADDIQPKDLATYLENANALLFDTPVIGASLYKSDDGGATWTKTHKGYLDNVYNSYGYYFGVVTADPSDINTVYIAGVPILRSDDGGATFSNINGQNVHVDHHIIWVNPEQPNHVINGNDGGINISYDQGANWIKCNSPSVAQFYYINADQAKEYNVYGGAQDNGVWMGSHRYRPGVRWHNSGSYPYQSLVGGDGMQIQIDPRDNETVYAGLQFGFYFRLNSKTKDRRLMTPQQDLGSSPYRWNWQTPILLSQHQPDILYMGAHKLLRSLNRGDDFDEISEDLTQGGKKGDVPYGTLTTIHESPLRFGLLYTGSDDGLIQVTRDGGYSWNNISNGLPKDRYVSRVQASAHKEGRVFASLNGYRSDDFAAYLYMSDDYGQTWKSIASNLPKECINVIKEDPHHGQIIYVGTDRGAYVSTNTGQTFSRFIDDLPNVPVHDIVVQADAKDLLIGTHGRSIFKADLEAIYLMAGNANEVLALQSMDNVRFSSQWGKRRNVYSDYFVPEQNIIAYASGAGKAKMSIKHGDDTIHEKEVTLSKGLNYISYDLTLSSKKANQLSSKLELKKGLEAAQDGNTYLPAGKYELMLEQGKASTSTTFEIKQR